ncbi:unnamed protein product [Notodromas monacha]|uniref:Uncharacterized protein n=1 Tax=Notodromas monacha TaxID=399045 RepID=A0A7R9BWQ1_9CRUS|nr:unnamed protein product [Notodromas monacha]CAG0922000.1 unnamed protein product [Notodromas monacha]
MLGLEQAGFDRGRAATTRKAYSAFLGVGGNEINGGRQHSAPPLGRQTDFDSKSTMDEYMFLDDSIRDMEKTSPLKRLELKQFALAQVVEELENKEQELTTKEYALNHIYNESESGRSLRSAFGSKNADVVTLRQELEALKKRKAGLEEEARALSSPAERLLQLYEREDELLAVWGSQQPSLS